MRVPAIPHHVRRMLADTYGGTVRNTTYIAGETCDVCLTPVYGYTRCRPCSAHASQPVADRVGAAVYAVEGERLRAQPTSAPRTLNASHYRADRAVQGGHTLIIDDTWTTGAHAQSAALAVRNAGAGQVSVLNIARYIKPSFGPTKKFLASHQRQDLDPFQCCWTGGPCPG